MEPRSLRDRRLRERAELTRRTLVAGVAAGAIATALGTVLWLGGPALVGARLPDVAARALAALRARPPSLALVSALHLGYGALAGGLYAVGARRVSLASGLFFGLGLWGVAAAVYAPLVGLGFAASRAPTLALLTLPAHLVYGGTLGLLATRGEIVQPLGDAPTAALGDG
jgi:hypothetical protein